MLEAGGGGGQHLKERRECRHAVQAPRNTQAVAPPPRTRTMSYTPEYLHACIAARAACEYAVAVRFAGGGLQAARCLLVSRVLHHT